MQVFRLTRKKYKIALSGKGAAIKGARWNSKGTDLIYSSASRALAMAEVFIHLNLNIVPDDFVMLEIDIPKALRIGVVATEELPLRWNAFPYHLSTQLFGDRLVSDNTYAILQVPSAIVPGDFNYLLNPYHPDFSKIRIKTHADFPMDNRLFKT